MTLKYNNTAYFGLYPLGQRKAVFRVSKGYENIISSIYQEINYIHFKLYCIFTAGVYHKKINFSNFAD